jgi:hypothetical protein
VTRGAASARAHGGFWDGTELIRDRERALHVVPFPYAAEFKLDERTTFLRWVGTMDGHKIESFEVIVDNEHGLIVERTIALRPYPAVKLFRDAMYAALKDRLPSDVWDYPTP